MEYTGHLLKGFDIHTHMAASCLFICWYSLMYTEAFQIFSWRCMTSVYIMSFFRSVLASIEVQLCAIKINDG